MCLLCTCERESVFLVMLRLHMCLNERMLGGGWEMKREREGEREREREREIICAGLCT